LQGLSWPKPLSLKCWAASEVTAGTNQTSKYDHFEMALRPAARIAQQSHAGRFSSPAHRYFLSFTTRLITAGLLRTATQPGGLTPRSSGPKPQSSERQVASIYMRRLPSFRSPWSWSLPVTQRRSSWRGQMSTDPMLLSSHGWRSLANSLIWGLPGAASTNLVAVRRQQEPAAYALV